MSWELAISIDCNCDFSFEKGLGLPLRDSTPKFNTLGFDTLMIIHSPALEASQSKHARMHAS
jgi:hypothetical protein